MFETLVDDIMDKNSSEFGYQISGTSRGLNSSEASNRNPIDLEFNRVRTQFGYFREDGGAVIRPVDHKDVSLRQWLDDRKRVVDAFECLHIFTQIVEIVNLAHSQGIVVQNVRPSCFVMSSLNRVSFIESASCSDSDSDSNMVSDTSWLQSGLDNVDTSCFEQAEEKKPCFPMKRILEMENDWYTSPEEAAGLSSSCASDIYRLGALLFELYCTCSSAEEKYATMSSLRHRVFPPHLLLKWPKEALFCLWLLHPEPASRPKIEEVLQSEFLTKLKDSLDERVAVIDIKEKIEEQELLLEFLLMMQHRKQEAADSLRTTISVLTSDLEEVMKLHSSVNKKAVSSLNLDDCASSRSRKRIHQTSENQESSIFKSPRLMKNFKKLESAYFLTRQRAGKQSRWINSFMDGICKYLTYSKLKVKADFNQVDLLSSSNLVCSLSFDRDGEFFATAGVNKKIKVFEYDSILHGNHDIHYPVAEMGSGSKLSSICFNKYVKGQIASSNFDGVVQVWDVTRSQVFMEMKEHERRAWSVDFSSADPKLLASGSDDGSVKLWNINQGVAVGTIKTKANVCCVQFPTDSSNSLAFGSADHRIYYYDLRNPSRPLCTFVGHDKTVSYVKFIDATTLVSSSTDNTLKLWDLSQCSSHVVGSPIQSFKGHTNVKNFVGLSVSDGYIATGSETNEVFIYHKAFPMPALSYKFNIVDPISGDEVEDNEQFVSSVCWRNQTSTLVAANSMGEIKLLEMV